MFDYDECRKDEFVQGATIACQGVEGAYSQMAADHLFSDSEIMYMRTFDGVFRAVESGLARYGILPIENSSAGSVTGVYDLMKQYRFFIARSVKMPISHTLLARQRIAVADLVKVYTHEQAIKQCGDFLEKHPHIEIRECANTAKAAELVAQSDDPGIGAIASESCADLYNLTVLKRNIQNSKNNYTRFICISKECEIYDGADRVGLMLTLEHKAGSLYQVIKEFAESGFNLLKLESRPIADTDFEFMFYFDIEATVGDPALRALLERLEEKSRQLVFLGNYQEVVIDDSYTISSEELPLSG